MTLNRKQRALRELDDAAGELLLAVQLIESDCLLRATHTIECVRERVDLALRILQDLRDAGVQP